MRRTMMIGLGLGMMMQLLGGCDTVDRIDNRIDCRQICTRYAECFDEGYDVAECETNCRDEANTDSDYQSKVDACENCMDDESCASGAFECADECINVVP